MQSTVIQQRVWNKKFNEVFQIYSEFEAIVHGVMIQNYF